MGFLRRGGRGGLGLSRARVGALDVLQHAGVARRRVVVGPLQLLRRVYAHTHALAPFRKHKNINSTRQVFFFYLEQTHRKQKVATLSPSKEAIRSKAAIRPLQHTHTCRLGVCTRPHVRTCDSAASRAAAWARAASPCAVAAATFAAAAAAASRAEVATCAASASRATSLAAAARDARSKSLRNRSASRPREGVDVLG